MKTFYAGALLLLCSVSIAQGTDIQRGNKIFKQSCSFCHGNKAEKSALNQSRPLSQMSVEELVAELKKRKEGEVIGAGNAAKSRLSEEDMQSVAEFIQTLK
ncbi:c-type cytochrome [[Haemophilus] felis]|uniref:Cytochrome C biogenesis protein CcsB n=1 Tax=[Haemophilus] felis TaxID=123822 RepID=A0A1T0AWE7_9PAST|nr:c-type cytochrome [[Haemophilus] felis]NBI40493.1 c-type cytochrome [[Haemophilus] felis]NBI42070.1 c-type cytochrome [[Haemophilus] felis]OOS02088.1 cytochrome C biogenesis protein CcsB [[Haemophilus] felis]